MRKSTCYARLYNTTAPPFTSICDNALAMELTKKLCCCTVGQGWLDPDVLAELDDAERANLSCDDCPIPGTGWLLYDWSVETVYNLIDLSIEGGFLSLLARNNQWIVYTNNVYLSWSVLYAAYNFVPNALSIQLYCSTIMHSLTKFAYYHNSIT